MITCSWCGRQSENTCSWVFLIVASGVTPVCWHCWFLPEQDWPGGLGAIAANGPQMKLQISDQGELR